MVFARESGRTSALNKAPPVAAGSLPGPRLPPHRLLRRAWRVAVVDPDESIHLSVREALGQPAHRWVVQGCRHPTELLASYPAEAPEVVLLAIEIEGMSGIDWARRLRTLLPRLPVIMHTTRSDSGAVFQCIMAGARGYLVKPVSVSELRRAIACVLAGWSALGPVAAQGLVAGLHRAGAQARAHGLTAREQAVAACSFQGLVNKEISQTLNVAPETVHAYWNHIRVKLDAPSRESACRRLVGVE